MPTTTKIGTWKFENDEYVHILVETVEERISHRKDWPEVTEIIVESGLILVVAGIVVDFLSHKEIPYNGFMITSEDLGLAFDHTKLSFFASVENNVAKRERWRDVFTPEQYVYNHMIGLRNKLELKILDSTDYQGYKEFLESVPCCGNIYEYIKDIIMYFVDELQEGEVRICTG